MKHRDVIKKTRPGPGQDAAKRRALSVRPSCLCLLVCLIYKRMAVTSRSPRLSHVCPQVLKQKRLYENQREQLYNQQFNMEQTSFALESIKDTAQTVQAMKAAGAELKSAFKKQDLNIDGIEKLQDEMADLMVGSALNVLQGLQCLSVLKYVNHACMCPLAWSLHHLFSFRHPVPAVQAAAPGSCLTGLGLVQA